MPAGARTAASRRGGSWRGGRSFGGCGPDSGRSAARIRPTARGRLLSGRGRRSGPHFARRRRRPRCLCRPSRAERWARTPPEREQRHRGGEGAGVAGAPSGGCGPDSGRSAARIRPTCRGGRGRGRSTLGPIVGLNVERPGRLPAGAANRLPIATEQQAPRPSALASAERDHEPAAAAPQASSGSFSRSSRSSSVSNVPRTSSRALRRRAATGRTGGPSRARGRCRPGRRCRSPRACRGRCAWRSGQSTSRSRRSASARRRARRVADRDVVQPGDAVGLRRRRPPTSTC